MGVFGGKSSSSGGGDKKKKIPNSRKKKHRNMEGAMDFNETFANNPNNNANNGEITPLAQHEELIITETTSVGIEGTNDQSALVANQEPVDESVGKDIVVEADTASALLQVHDGTTALGDVFTLVDKITIEKWRIFGLGMSIVMMVVGTILSTLFVWDKLEIKEETYIMQMFHFSHTCVEIDFNPAKTVSAILILFAIYPLMIFTYLQKGQIGLAYQKNKDLKNVYIFSQGTWGIRFACFAYFFMIFVNSPDGEYTDPTTMSWREMFSNQGWRKFLGHFIPFFCWQLALALMSIEQTWFHYASGNMPFRFITPKFLVAYCSLTVVVLAYYAIWVVGFVFGFHIPGHTKIEDDGSVSNLLWCQFVMFFYLALTTVIPIIISMGRVFGLCGTTKSKRYVITISLLKEDMDEAPVKEDMYEAPVKEDMDEASVKFGEGGYV